MTAVQDQEIADLRRTIDTINEDRYTMQARIARLETERVDAMKSAAMYSEDADEMEARLENAQRDAGELLTVLKEAEQFWIAGAALTNAWSARARAVVAKYEVAT